MTSIYEMTKDELEEAIKHYDRLIESGVDYRNGKKIPDNTIPLLNIHKHYLEKALEEKQGTS